MSLTKILWACLKPFAISYTRRRGKIRTSMISDPFIVDAELMSALKVYALSGDNRVVNLTAQFLNTYCNELPLLEAYEIDNFILRNGKTLSAWYTHPLSCLKDCCCQNPSNSAWKFYDSDQPGLVALRAPFLLRILVVDVEPFDDLLNAILVSSDNWESR